MDYEVEHNINTNVMDYELNLSTPNKAKEKFSVAIGKLRHHPLAEIKYSCLFIQHEIES